MACGVSADGLFVAVYEERLGIWDEVLVAFRVLGKEKEISWKKCI